MTCLDTHEIIALIEIMYIFIIPNVSSFPFQAFLSTPSHAIPSQKQMICSLSPQISFCFQKSYIQGVIQYVLFNPGVLSVSVIILRFFHIVVERSPDFFFLKGSLIHLLDLVEHVRFLLHILYLFITVRNAKKFLSLWTI